MDINCINLDNGYKLIEASAGTGKTFTLAHLFLRSYFENQLNIENILLLSFTNKTCNELKERIIERVLKLELLINNKISSKDLDQTILLWYEKQILNNNKEQIRFKIKEFLNNINNLKIFTFHGFCNNIIENNSFEINSPQGFNVNNEIDYLYKDIINELWISEYNNLDSNIIKSIYHKKIKSKWSKVSSINKKFFLHLLKDIDNENIFKYKYKNTDKNQNTSIILKDYIIENWLEFINNWKKDGYDLYLKLIEFGNEIKEKGFISNVYKSKPRKKFEEINKWIETINNNILEYEAEYQFIYEITKSDLLTKYFYRKSVYKEADKFNISIDLSEFDNLQESIYKLKDDFYNQFIRIFLNKLFFKLSQKKYEKGILNYSDIIKTIENKFLLDSESIVLFKSILNKYSAVFIDEFQDTDKVQWNIVSSLFRDPEHLLICVGDPKQAIYKFRGGDIKAYLKAKNEAVEIYKLDVNYRSSNKLIKIINKLYKNGLKNSGIDYVPLKSYNISSTSDLNKVFNIIEFKDQKDIPDITLDFLLRLFLSDEKINLESIAILTSNNYQCLFYKNLLSKYNIPCNIVNKNSIFDTEASNLLELFLECINNPNSSKNIKILATSKLINIDINQLLDFENSNEIDTLFKKFKIWNLEIKDRGLFSILREFIIIFRSPKLINDQDLYSNLIQLSEIIEKKMISENFNISKVINWFKYENNLLSRTLKGDEYLVNNNNQISAINISTVHSSKGLEYQTVICPYLWDQKKVFSKANGPIWRDYINNEIYINIENSSKKVSNIRETDFVEQLSELERLIYVALTRAKNRLIIFNNIEKKDSILNNHLLSSLDNYSDLIYKIDSKLKDKDLQKLENKFKNKINNEFERIYLSKREKNKSLMNKKIIIRSSYSSWINGTRNFNLFNLDKDYDENISYQKKDIRLIDDKDNLIFKEPNPLSDFPKGTNSGSCLHNILERLNFQEINNNENFNALIEEELFAYGIDKKFTKNIQQGIRRVVYSSLGEYFQNQRLIDLSTSDILKEVKFHLPLSINGKSITSNQLSKCFFLNKKSEFGEDYANAVQNLNINSKGFHSGSIDCLLQIKGNDNLSKWWIIDWKSNFICNEDDNKSIPINYNYENMRFEMIKHHYPLQSHLYLLAVHRLLKWRLGNYNPDNDLGGYIYIFIRGLPNEKIINKTEHSKYPFGIFYSKAPIDRILYLDNLFKNGFK